MKNKKRIIIINFILFIYIIIVGVSYAFWSEAILGSDKNMPNNSVEIGLGQPFYSTITINSSNNDGLGKKLVPINRVTMPNDISQINYQYQVSWKENGFIGNPPNNTNNFFDGVLLVAHHQQI